MAKKKKSKPSGLGDPTVAMAQHKTKKKGKR
jgi:hypothetical protein